MQLSNSDQKLIIRLKNAGKSTREIRRLTGFHQMQIMRVLHPVSEHERAKISERGKEARMQKPPKYRPPDINTLFEAGRFLSSREGEKAMSRLRRRYHPQPVGAP